MHINNHKIIGEQMITTDADTNDSDPVNCPVQAAVAFIFELDLQRATITGVVFNVYFSLYLYLSSFLIPLSSQFRSEEQLIWGLLFQMEKILVAFMLV